MRKFILKSAAFALLVVLIIGGVCTAEIVAEIRAYRREIVAPSGATILLCGDSQLGNAVDPAICPEFFNFSAHGRALDQDYMVMLDILRANPERFDMVVVDVSPAAATWPLDKPLHEMSFSSAYWLIHYLHPRENTRSLSHGFGVVRDNLVGRRLRHAWRAIRGKIDFRSSLYGHFTPLLEVNRQMNPPMYNGLLNQKAILTKGAADIGEHALMFQTLNRMASAAASAGVEMVVVTTPWNRELINLCGESELDRFTDKLRGWTRKKGLRYVNLLKSEFPDECWLDANHLNVAGSKIFTRELKRELKK